MHRTGTTPTSADDRGDVSLRILLTSVHAWPEVVRGGERYLHELAAALQRAGHAVRVHASAREARRDTVLGVPTVRWRERPLSRFGEQSVEVGFGLQSLRLAPRAMDVWHATSTGDAAAAAFTGRARPRLATVFTDHGFPVSASRERRRDARLHRYVVDHIGAYVCVSPAAAHYLETDFGRTACVVPPGVHLPAYAPAARRSSRPTIAYVGSLDEPRKNVAPLLEAAVVLARDVPDLDVWLLGPGDADGLLRTVPDARRLVSVAGAVPPAELTERYGRAWATVLPSYAESFGMVVIESLASGTPAVVLADSGGPAGLVQDGITGVVADGVEPEELAAACHRALDLARRPGTAEACRGAAEAYDWDGAIVPRLEEVYARAR